MQKVADIRVLALNVASRQVKNETTTYRNQILKGYHSAMDAYNKEYKNQFKKGEPSFAEHLNLHDCMVLSCRKKGKDVVLTLDNSDSHTDINQIRMKNCEVIKQDASLYGAWCLYEEIYKSGDKYEIHFLLDKNKLIDYIVSVDDLEYQYD